MFPPFASSEGYSASGVRYQSDGVSRHPPHYLILNPLAFARGCVILRSHVLILLLLFILISRIRRNLFIHIARIPIGDSPRVYPNILKCSLHSPVARVIRLVVFATRATVCDTRTHCLILNSLASARGRVILRSHFLILLLLIILISLYILSYFSLIQ